eukprot:6213575-Pleurochrysis_carterae.AAC.3
MGTNLPASVQLGKAQLSSVCKARDRNAHFQISLASSTFMNSHAVVPIAWVHYLGSTSRIWANKLESEQPWIATSSRVGSPPIALCCSVTSSSV